MLSDLSDQKLKQILCCPGCYNGFDGDERLYCSKCGKKYPFISGIPAPINDQSVQSYLSRTQKVRDSLREKIKSKIPLPDERIWTNQAKKVISKTLLLINPDAENSIVVNMGSGTESFYKKIFKPFKGIIRIGIPHSGEVNAYGDAMTLPIKNNSVDLLISSSVIEHLPNPEKAVSELFRVIKPMGLVYAEIPFIGAYHMAPHDYQRYTIMGIESLFTRHGFELVEKGICSGPSTALVLLLQHAIVEAIPLGPAQYFIRLILAWILHPFKYFDIFFSRTKWGTYLACNFFFLGRKVIELS